MNRKMWTILLAMAALCIGFFVGRATKPRSGLDEFVSVAEKNNLDWSIGGTRNGDVYAQLVNNYTQRVWSTSFVGPSHSTGFRIGAEEAARRIVDQFRNTPGRDMVQRSQLMR
jgi:hypothetical protein